MLRLQLRLWKAAFKVVGWAVRVVAAFLTSGFEERIGVDFKGLRALGWPVKGVGAVPQFFVLVLPQNL